MQAGSASKKGSPRSSSEPEQRRRKKTETDEGGSVRVKVALWRREKGGRLRMH
jgi:hypothetical protein